MSKMKRYPVAEAVQRVRNAKDESGLTGKAYRDFLEELLAEAEGWRMELEDLHPEQEDEP